MKSGKSNKAEQKQIVHPVIFSISVFECVQQFIALYMGIQSIQSSQVESCGTYLRSILQRTKSPPISLTYTHEFLLPSTQSEIQLSIIRFISQLSDLSAGRSMQSSLSYIIENSSFLTQLRHNLTHRVMVKGLVIERGRQIILNELKQKYWKLGWEQVWNVGSIDEQKVKLYFNTIINYQNKFKEFEDEDLQIGQNMKKSKLYLTYQKYIQGQNHYKLTPDYLYTKCHNNYEFKNLFKGYIFKKVIPEICKLNESNIEEENNENEIQITQEMVIKYFNIQSIQQVQVFQTRGIIVLCTLFDTLLYTSKYSNSKNINSFKIRHILSQIIVKFIQILPRFVKRFQNKAQKNINIIFNLFFNPIITKKLRQIYLLKCVTEFKQVINAVPSEISQEIVNFFNKLQQQTGKSII